MSEELNLGQIIATPQQRDAIHIAVLPVTGAHDETLLPGQHIGFAESGYCVTGNPQAPYKLVGIVDPFLTAPVTGKRFWMWLYPNTIVSLRHNWSHPAISQDGMGVGSTSEKWLRDFAVQVDADYHQMMAVAETHCEGGSGRWGADYLIEGGKWEGQGTPAEFWTHFENVTGKKPKVDEYDGKKYTPGIFSCSC